MIRLRWIAVGGIIAAVLLGTYAFGVLTHPAPLYLCAAVLLVCNISYFAAATKKPEEARPRDLLLGMIQVEADLFILTAVLDFSGGVVNPFFLFYVFHVIIAAIILPRSLSCLVGLTAIVLFGLLEVNELYAGRLLGYYPLRLPTAGSLWRNPVYAFAVFGAFSCTVILAQYLTRMIVARMSAKELEVARVNEILRVSRLEMAQREKMVAIGQMATGIAHEIGNPLASISSVAQYLIRKSTVHEQKEHLLIIQNHVQRISNILRRMLSLSRPATGEYRWTDVNALIDDTLSLITFDKRARSVTVKNVANPDVPAVWLNPQNFEQVLLNIFINALDAMNAKPAEQKHLLRITREFTDGMVEIRISDTGIGMNSEVRRHAFDPFFTTKKMGEGTGLGLYISHNLVAEIHGTVTLESELDKGTVVVIRIPPRSRKDLIGGDDAEDSFFKRAQAV
ncbi:MAG: hypothetical protein A2Z25_10920 [Planctomycetes bacterium RBG_16_55_9]|nr:MAG: hypothetical protein A2Z25_10920 [Planctomycetes bacterium RBG_16_55_9]